MIAGYEIDTNEYADQSVDRARGGFAPAGAADCCGTYGSATISAADAEHQPICASSAGCHGNGSSASDVSLSLAERFWSQVAIGGPDECWLFTGPGRAGSQNEYGSYQYGPSRPRENGRGYYQPRTTSHRVAFYLHYGHWPTPVGRHTCDTPLCCNPFHIVEGTHADNARDCSERGRRSTAKLNPDAVRAIRASGETLEALAARFGVTNQLVSMVRNGHRWRHVADVPASDHERGVPLRQHAPRTTPSAATARSSQETR